MDREPWLLKTLALLLCIGAACRTGAGREPTHAQPGRIVSLAPNLTEMLFAIGAGDQVVGVTDFCDTPPQVRKLSRVGGYVNPNLEAVLSLAPNLVVATPNVGNRPFVERLMRLGVRVEVVQARNVSEIFPALEALGRATGHAPQARELSMRISEGIAAVRSRVAGRPRPRALICIQLDPLIVAGPGSYPHDLLLLAGGESIVPASAGSYPALSLEEVIRAGPEVVIQTRMDAPVAGRGQEGSNLLDWWSRWRSVPAVAAGRVHAVSGDALLRPGPRILEGLNLLVRIVHPELADSNSNAAASGRSGP